MRKILLGVFILFSAYSNAQIVNDWYDSTSFHGGVSVGSNLRIPSGAVNGYVLTTNGAGLATWQASQGGGGSTIDTSNFWNINGNSGTTAGTNFVGTTDSVALFLQALKSFVALGFPTQNRGVFVGNIPYLGDTAFYSSLLNYIINADNNFDVTASNNVNLNATNELNLASNSRTTIKVNDSTFIVIDDTSINVKTISGTTEAGYFHQMNRETGNCSSNIYVGKLDSLGGIIDLLRVATTLNKADYSQSNAHIFVSTDYDNPVEHNGVDIYPSYAQMVVNKTDDAQATGNSLTLDSIGKLNFWSSGSNKFSIDTNGNPTIPIGASNGYVLTSDANGLGSWQAESMTLISTVTASNSATVDFTGLSSGSYVIYYTDVIPTTTSTTLNFRYGTGGTPTYQTSNYVYSISFNLNTGATITTSNSTSAGSFVLHGVTTGTGEGVSGVLTMLNPSGTSIYHPMTFTANDFNGGNNYYFAGGGCWKSTTAVTAGRFYFSSGNISSGTFKIYKIK